MSERRQPIIGRVPEGVDVGCRCPACGRFHTMRASYGAMLGFMESVAVSTVYVCEDNRPVYLVTCDQHGLADVYAIVHGRSAA